MDLIIKFLDDYLTRTGRKRIGAVEANAILAKAGILPDCKDRPGKPLRDLLRKGLIPHAYQSGGKGSEWIIPHSGKSAIRISNYSAKNKPVKASNLPKTVEPEKVDLSMLKHQLENARQKYKPELIKYLLIAEAPPDNLERFFYYPDVRNHDYLFLGVAETLYPDMKKRFLTSRRDGEIKNSILRKFQHEGFYLLDLSELPLSYLDSSLPSQIPNLIVKIKSLVNAETKIILIKKSIYDIAFNSLKQEYNVADKRITFPGQGGQLKFQDEFKEALKMAGYIFKES